MNTEPKIKSQREVELEIACELARDTLSMAIDTMKFTAMSDTLEIQAKMLQAKNRIIKTLEGRNGI